MKNYTKQIDSYLKRFFPITRSITGNGNRETLKILKEIAPLSIKEIPSGKKVYDWVVPKEWNIRDAWVKNSKGEKIIDFKGSNLHVVSYSVPVHKKLKGSELKKRLHYLKDLPKAIPYRTSYYKKDWGFCLSFNDYKKHIKEKEEYEVFIDSDLKKGSLTYGELLIKGKSKKEVLISTYICHPSMANDNLSGPILTAFLARELMKKKLNYSYRIIFVPETIGAIVYCAKNEKVMKDIDIGLVVTCTGGKGKYGYKQSFDKGCYLNEMVESVFKEKKIGHKVYPFSIHGSDERQYSSQGFRINCVSICKDKYYDYKFYHTSLDDLSFVRPEYINKSLGLYVDLIDKLETQVYYKNIRPNCEVMLGKHDLYPKTGGSLLPKGKASGLDIILWLFFLCDGKRSIREISGRLSVPDESVLKAAKMLEKRGLLKKL